MCTDHYLCALFTSCVRCSLFMCAVHELCALFTSYVYCSLFMCAVHKLCALFTRYVRCSRVMCAVHELCALFTSYVRCSRVMCTVHIPVVNIQWNRFEAVDLAIRLEGRQFKELNLTISAITWHINDTSWDMVTWNGCQH